MAFPQTVRWINEILNNLSQVRLFLVPSGGVILWHGASNAVPKGWAICDGTNGTPDLRDRFVIGAGGKYGLYGKLYGLSDDVIAQLETIYNKELADTELGRRLDLALKLKEIRKNSSSRTDGNGYSVTDILNGAYR